MSDAVSLFLYLSVIITPDGTVKAHSEVVQECPSTEYVMSTHKKMMDAGDILDWRARCSKYDFDFDLPQKGLAT
jgi:hypothetical protein